MIIGKTLTNRAHRRGVRAVAALAAVVLGLVAGVGMAAPARADFFACPSGNACLWSDASMNNLSQWTSSSVGGCCANEMGWSAKAFGNRKSSTCARFREWAYVAPVGWQSTLHATASSNTGNSQGGSTRVIDQISLVSGSC